MEKQMKFWCHSCKSQFEATESDTTCRNCRGDFCQEITPENNPVGYVPYEVRQSRPRNLTRHVQQNWIINSGPLFSFSIGNQLENNYMDNVLEYIRRIDPNRYGAPPASKEQVSKLNKIKFNSETAEGGVDECSICKQKFKEGEELIQMPCKHPNHSGCILPWLESRNSCPLCRFELKTDDPNYEESKKRRATQN